MAENPRDAAAIRAGIERARQDIEQSVNALRANVSLWGEVEEITVRRAKRRAEYDSAVQLLQMLKA